MNQFFTPESLAYLVSTMAPVTRQDGTRLDSLGQSMLAAGVLEDVQARAVDYLYPQLKARQLLPMATDIDEGADTVVWFEYDRDTMAEIITNYADDLPEVAVEAQPQSSPVKSIGISYSYSTEDLRRVMFARANGRQAQLNVDKARVADEGIERKIDQIAIKGDSATGLPGLCRNANVTALQAAASANGGFSRQWDGADKDAEEIFDDVVNLISSMYTASNGVHTPNVVAMPVSQFNVLKTTQFLTSTATPMTILEALQRQHSEVTFVDWAALSEGYTGDADVVVAMDVRDTMNLEMVVPMEARPLPPQPDNFKFKVPVEAKTGGVIIKRPLAVVYMYDV